MNKRDLYRLHHRNLGLSKFLGSEGGHVLGATVVVRRGCTSTFLGNMNRKLTEWVSGPESVLHEKQTVGTVTASRKMLTLQALSSSLIASTAKRGCLGREKAFG